jgi:hypothetical protein
MKTDFYAPEFGAYQAHKWRKILRVTESQKAVLVLKILQQFFSITFLNK